MFSIDTDLYGKKGISILKNIPNKILDAGQMGQDGYVPSNADDKDSIDIYKSFRYR